ncbi:ras guanine nucleotide exchange factor domain-containing protein [Obelidium mucronatum]|nr:ras guanine nucleotide exchange factor domain-containing protein [Obelidium mucronatum]
MRDSMELRMPAVPRRGHSSFHLSVSPTSPSAPPPLFFIASPISPASSLSSHEPLIPTRQSSLLSSDQISDNLKRSSAASLAFSFDPSVRSPSPPAMNPPATTLPAEPTPTPFTQLSAIKSTVSTIMRTAQAGTRAHLMKLVHDMVAQATIFIKTAEDDAFVHKQVDPDIMDGFLRSRTNVYFQACNLTVSLADAAAVTVKSVIEKSIHVECACVELFGALQFLVQSMQPSEAIGASMEIQNSTDDLMQERPTSDTTLVSKPTDTVENPWYLGIDYSEKDLVLDSNGNIMGGTLEALIAKLTSHEEVDIKTIQFIQTFLLGYRGFTTSSVLIQHLIQRFKLQAPAKLNADELRVWVTEKRDVIRRRVVDILEVWLERHYLFTVLSDNRAVSILNRFILSSMRDSDLVMSQELQSTIAHCLERSSNFDFDDHQLTPTSQIYNNFSTSKRDFFEFSAVDVARELTRMEYRYFFRVSAQELVDKTLKPRSEAPNVAAVMNFAVQVAGWVTAEVLSKQDIEERKVVLERFILVAKACKDLKNYATLFSIVEALDSSPIHRLKKTWSLVDKQAKSMFENLKEITDMSNAYSNYRKELQTSAASCLPWLKLVLADLSDIHNQNPDKLEQPDKSTVLVNFSKHAKIAEVLASFSDFQQRGFDDEKDEEILAFLGCCLKSKTLQHNNSYNVSLELEPF